jgi:hypothetical protein
LCSGCPRLVLRRGGQFFRVRKPSPGRPGHPDTVSTTDPGSPMIGK